MLPYYNRPAGYYEQPNMGGIKGRPVTSIEEARASMIDFDGSTFYFPDINNQTIYAKQINLDGTASMRIYQLVEKDLSTKEPEYATKQDLENFKIEIQKLMKGGTDEPESNATFKF